MFHTATAEALDLEWGTERHRRALGEDNGGEGGGGRAECESEMAERQSRGREINAASPGGKPDPATSDDAVKRTGLKARKAAGPDGPDATVVGDTFKRAPDSRRSRSKPTGAL